MGSWVQSVMWPVAWWASIGPSTRAGLSAAPVAGAVSRIAENTASEMGSATRHTLVGRRVAHNTAPINTAVPTNSEPNATTGLVAGAKLTIPRPVVITPGPWIAINPNAATVAPATWAAI